MMDQTAVSLFLVDADEQHAAHITESFRQAGFLNPVKHFSDEPQVMAELDRLPDNHPLLLILSHSDRLDCLDLLSHLRHRPNNGQVPVMTLVPVHDQQLCPQLKQIGCEVLTEQETKGKALSKYLASLGFSLKVTLGANVGSA